MRTKLPLIFCFFCTSLLSAQGTYKTKGIFNFLGELSIPEKYECGPGQLTKDGTHFILGLTEGNFEDYYDLLSNIYAITLSDGNKTPAITSYNLPNALDSVRYFQCAASAHEQTLVYVVNAMGGWNENQLGIAEKNPDGSYGSIRMLDEANDSELSDAYPWISEDGLRLIFCRNFKLFGTSRNTVSEKFKTPEEIHYNGDVNLEIVSCWLTPNEKTMFIVSNNLIYTCTRKSKTSTFSFPQVFTNEFKDFYFIAGLSFMPDKKTMYVYYSDLDAQKIIKYQLKKGKAW